MRQPLTAKQQKVYDLLLQKKNINEIAKELGNVPATIHENLTRMEKKGWAMHYKHGRPTWGPVEEFSKEDAKKMLEKIQNKYPSLLIE